MPGLGIQSTLERNLLDQLMADNMRMQQEIIELRAAQRRLASWTLKMGAEDDPVEVKSPAIVLPIPRDADGLRLEVLEAAVTNASFTGDVTIWVYNVTQGFDMITDYLTILSGDYHSDHSNYIIDNKYAQVFWRDKVYFDVVNAPAGAEGLSIHVGFV